MKEQLGYSLITFGVLYGIYTLMKVLTDRLDRIADLLIEIRDAQGKVGK